MPISVTVKTLDSQNHKFDNLDDDITVALFKAHISPTVGMPPERQRLIYCGRVLHDEKKLNEYVVDGKVIHLVQRPPNLPTNGPDPVAASEARARGASPARGRAHHHLIHIQQEPDIISSMSFRLNIARDLLSRANRAIARLENPNAPEPNQASPPEGNVGGLPMGLSPQLMQVIQSAVNSAVHSINATTAGRGIIQPGQSFEMSVRVGPQGQLLSQNLSQSARPAGASVAGSNNAVPNSTAPGVSRTDGSMPTSNDQVPPRTSRNQHQLQHPPLASLADAMDEYEATERRFLPFRTQVRDLMRQDPTFSSDNERQEAQNLFWRCMEIMHFLSHVQHALSDAMVNMSQNPPRHIRARPLMIQSRPRVQSATVTQNLPFGLGGFGAAAAARQTTEGSRTTTASSAPASSVSATATPSAATTTTSQEQRPMEVDSNNIPQAFAEVEVNVEPIIVGIEVESGEIGLPGALGVGQGSLPANFMQMFQTALMNATRPPQPQASSTEASEPSPDGISVQDSQARGDTQTQPTTSTQTRSSSLIHHPARGAVGQTFSSMMMPPPSFDPLLPCSSHLISANFGNRRTRHPAGPQITPRPRSASVPPRNQTNAENQDGRQQPNAPGSSTPQPTQASSARSSPLRTPRLRSFGNLEFEMDYVPIMFPQQAFPNMPSRSSTTTSAQSQTAPSAFQGDAVEPSLANLLGNLQTSGDNNDASMIGVVLGIMNEVRGVFSDGGPGSSQQRTIGDYLEGLPDYSYIEGESLVTDLLMTLARSTTFSDLVSILWGSSESLGRIQIPLQQFVRRYILVPPNDDEQHDIDSAILQLVDISFPTLEEMAREANVRPDVDFPETVHSFLAANLSILAEIILRTSSPSEFNDQFRQRGNQFLARLIHLCLRSFTDGNVSLERVARNRLDFVSGDVGANVREWISSAAVGHLRNYVAGINPDPSHDDIEQYVVRPGADSEQRKNARKRRLQQNSTREEETFVTPRSSPPRGSSPAMMDTDDHEQVASASTTFYVASSRSADLPPPSMPAEEKSFPANFLSSESVDSTVAIGAQPWHSTLPSNWVPIVTRDLHRQNGPDDQGPYSDAYLSTQPAKRRRLAARSKPEGSVEQVISDTLNSAINASGVQHSCPLEDILKDASSRVNIQQSLRNEVRSAFSRRMNRDPDYDPKKFPNSKDFASSK